MRNTLALAEYLCTRRNSGFLRRVYFQYEPAVGHSGAIGHSGTTAVRIVRTGALFHASNSASSTESVLAEGTLAHSTLPTSSGM